MSTWKQLPKRLALAMAFIPVMPLIMLFKNAERVRQ